MKHLNITIKGSVQMVLFRATAEKKAHEMGLFGFVRNEPDGSVYIEVEGDEAALEEFRKWCHEGPNSAQVESVDVTEGDTVNFKEFLIK